jgi:dTDP-L-rhamnose 4-epimerase
LHARHRRAHGQGLKRPSPAAQREEGRSTRVVVTGGWGFIGRAAVRELLARGHEVTVVDSLDPLSHPRRPPRTRGVRYRVCRVGDVPRWRDDLRRAQGLIHLAARVSVMESQLRPAAYLRANALETERMLRAALRPGGGIEKVLVASSVTAYGEGARRCTTHGVVFPHPRTRTALASRRWEPECPRCGKDTRAAATPETAPQSGTSIYSITKRVQEDLVRSYATRAGTAWASLRLFNVYGAGQNPANPYAGVVMMFGARAASGRAPIVFEDGRQGRDFLAVAEAARAFCDALERDRFDGRATNIATGKPTAVGAIARAVCDHFGGGLEPLVTGEGRLGDARTTYADLRAARRAGFRPRSSLTKDLPALLEGADFARRAKDSGRGQARARSAYRRAGVLVGGSARAPRRAR